MKPFLSSVYSAWLLLTILPFPRKIADRLDLQLVNPGKAGLAFSWVAGALGLLLSVMIALSGLETPLAQATLIVFATVILTGALHEDGFADFCDGLGVRHDKKRMLEVMKDPSTGVYAVIALIALFTLRLNFYFFIAQQTGLAAAALLSSLMLSRWVPNLLMFRLPYAGRSENEKIPGTSKEGDALTVCLGLVPCVFLLYFYSFFNWLLLVILTVALAFALCAWFRRLIGGYTGDLLGASVVITEIFVLCAIALQI